MGWPRSCENSEGLKGRCPLQYISGPELRWQIFLQPARETPGSNVMKTRHRASGLNLVVASIVLWNARYLPSPPAHERVMPRARAAADRPSDDAGATTAGAREHRGAPGATPRCWSQRAAPSLASDGRDRAPSGACATTPGASDLARGRRENAVGLRKSEDSMQRRCNRAGHEHHKPPYGGGATRTQAPALGGGCGRTVRRPTRANSSRNLE